MTVQPRNPWNKNLDSATSIVLGAKVLLEVVSPIVATIATLWLAFHHSTNVWCQRLLIAAAVFEFLSFLRYLRTLYARMAKATPAATLTPRKTNS